MNKQFLKRLHLLLFILLFAVAGCSTGDNSSPPSNLLTPTPPVPVFGNFVMGVGTSTSSDPSTQSFQKSEEDGSSGSSLIKGVNYVSLLNDTLRIEETRNVINHISFQPDQGPPNDIQFPGTFVVQLIHQGAITDLEFPDFGITTIPFALYHQFELNFKNLEFNEIPPELLTDPVVTQFLEGQTMVVEGSFLSTFGGLSSRIPFRIISDQKTGIRVSSQSGFTVSPNQVNYFFIAFRVESWFDGVLEKLQTLSPLDLIQGVAVITPENPNPLIQQILSLFENNVDRSLKSAPSPDAFFDESDVDESSSSLPF